MVFSHIRIAHCSVCAGRRDVRIFFTKFNFTKIPVCISETPALRVGMPVFVCISSQKNVYKFYYVWAGFRLLFCILLMHIHTHTPTHI